MAATVALYDLGNRMRRPCLTASTSCAPRPRRAIAAAGSAAELEELRVRYLGRKSELTQTLRSIGELPPEQRGPVGQGGQRGRARRSRQLLDRRTGELEAAELDRAWPRTAST